MKKRTIWKWTIAGFVLLLYLATWIFGVPSAHTDITRSCVQVHNKWRSQHPDTVTDRHPVIRFRASFPILPGVVIIHHERLLAKRFGSGVWSHYFWYGFGLKKLGSRPVWKS
jgi:hypothetical protein